MLGTTVLLLATLCDFRPGFWSDWTGGPTFGRRVVRRQGYETAILPPGGFRADHLGEERLDEVLRLDAEAMAGEVVEPGAAE